MEIYHQYVRLRKQFGRHPKFTNEGAEMIADIRPNEEHAKQYIPRNPVITVTQCVPEMSEHEANTVAVILASKAMSHVEGGWPKDIDYSEAEHTIRYRKKVEKDEDYVRTVAMLGGEVEELVKQNNAVDIYQEYFVGVTADHSAEVPSVKTITVFKDPGQRYTRSASYVNWHPDGTVPKVVVSYSILQFQQQPHDMLTSSYVWDVNNPNTPEYEMTPTSQICCSKFNLKDGNLIGAGQYNGQFSYYDMRKGTSPVETTPIDISHRDPIYDMAWLQVRVVRGEELGARGGALVAAAAGLGRSLPRPQRALTCDCAPSRACAVQDGYRGHVSVHGRASHVLGHPQAQRGGGEHAAQGEGLGHHAGRRGARVRHQRRPHQLHGRHRTGAGRASRRGDRAARA